MQQKTLLRESPLKISKMIKKPFLLLHALLKLLARQLKVFLSLCKNDIPKYPEKALSGMRDKLIHHYFGVNLQVLWDTVKQNLVLLKTIIREIRDQQ